MTDRLPFDPSTDPHAHPPTEGQPEEATASRVWFLSADELSATRAKLARILVRAEKKGFTGRVALHAQPATRSHLPAPGAPPITLHGFEVTITGRPPSYGGWRFLAAVDNVAGQPVLRYPPGAAETDLVANGSIRPGTCDHCHTTRPRTTTLLVRHETSGQVKQVGSGCLKDFLGWSTLPVFLDVDDLVGELRAHHRPTTGTQWSLESVLAYSWAIFATYGWTPASATGGRHQPTRDLVGTVLANGKGAEEILIRIADRLPQAPTMAARIITDLTPTVQPETAGYGANLKALLTAGVVPRRQLGLAVSMVNAWEHRDEAPARPAAETTEPARTLSHAGTVGDPITLTGTITCLLPLAGYHRYSPPQRLLIVDCGDTIAKTMTSAGWSHDLSRGDTVTLTGTVKAHQEYRGIPQTMLARCKLDARTPAADPAPAPATDTAGPAAAQPELWETVSAPRPPQSRFQEAPLAAAAPLTPALTF